MYGCIYLTLRRMIVVRVICACLVQRLQLLSSHRTMRIICPVFSENWSDSERLRSVHCYCALSCKFLQYWLNLYEVIEIIEQILNYSSSVCLSMHLKLYNLRSLIIIILFSSVAFRDDYWELMNNKKRILNMGLKGFSICYPTFLWVIIIIRNCRLVVLRQTHSMDKQIYWTFMIEPKIIT